MKRRLRRSVNWVEKCPDDEGLTIIIDGKLKEMFDIIINKTGKYEDYTGLMSNVILNGINKIIEENR